MSLARRKALRWERIEPVQGVITEFLKYIEGHAINLVGNQLWIIGGSSSAYKFELIFRTFNLETNVWDDARQLVTDGTIPSARQRHGSFITNDGIYVWGGIRFRGVMTTELWKFDTVLHEWTEVKQYGKLPLATSRFADGYIETKDEYVVCGGTAIGRLRHGVHVLMLQSRTWFAPIVKGAEPGHTAGVASTLVREQLYIYGGTDYKAASGDLWILDCAGPICMWSKPEVGQLCPGPRINATLTGCGGGNLFLVGGAPGMNMAATTNELYAYNIYQKRWVKAAAPQDNEEWIVTGFGPAVDMHAATPYSKGLIVLGANRTVVTEEVPIYKLGFAEG